MKRLLLTFCSLFLCLALYAQNKDIAKLWDYTAPEAPYGYQEGTILIKEKDGKLNGEIRIQQSTIAIKEIKKVENAYVWSFYVEGQPVDIKLTPKGKNQLEGNALSGGMNIPFTCKPAKK